MDRNICLIKPINIPKRDINKWYNENRRYIDDLYNIFIDGCQEIDIKLINTNTDEKAQIVYENFVEYLFRHSL